MLTVSRRVSVARNRSIVRRWAGDLYYKTVATFRPWVARASPTRLLREIRTAEARRSCEPLLRGLAASRPCHLEGPILVDGLWDNPNYWLRCTLLRAALGLAATEEIGLVGANGSRQVHGTLRRLNIRTTASLGEFAPAAEELSGEARSLLGKIQGPDDVLSCRLPFDFPPAWFYDGILRRQRKHSVDIHHGRFESYVVEALQSIYAADRLLRSRPFKLVALSHALNFGWGALAWRATQLGIPAVVLFGVYGVCRFVKITRGADLTEQVCRPSGREIDALDSERAEMLAAIGFQQLLARRAGKTDDFGSTHAYKKQTRMVTRRDITNQFGWNPSTPIVAVYVPNFFDFPHFFGMASFRDNADWLLDSLRVAKEVPEVNWLFRGHPLDQWYGGTTLADVMPTARHSHIGAGPDDWNSAGIQDGADAVITFNGTVGVEAAALGKPVLTADRGWYHDCGFVRWAETRDAYLRALREPWWRDIDLARSTRRARIFAGWYFGCPDWQENFVLPDDTNQASLYETMPRLLACNRDAIEREIAEIRSWMQSDHRLYHTFKMARARKVRVSCAISEAA